MTRVLIIDDHPIFRQGLRQLIDAEQDMSVVGEASDLESGAALLSDLRPEVAVIDLTLSNGSGLDLVRHCRSLRPAVAPLVLTMHREESTFEGALDRGAAGYILKENASSDVLLGIRAVAAGGFYLSPSIAGFLSSVRERRQRAQETPSGPLALLTPTERRVLRLIGGNRTTKEIAHELCISPRTVDTHRANICEKLELRGAQSLLRFALENRHALDA
jgi:DNA-binding NarL/FixJ family response regulator